MQRHKIISLSVATVLAGAILYVAFGRGNDGPSETDASKAGYVQLPAMTISRPAAPPKAVADLPQNLAESVRAELRDADWAPKSEKSIRATVGRLPFMDMGGTAHVYCAASICELSGSAPDMLSEKDLVQFWALLRSSIVLAPLARDGLEMGSASFGRPDNPRAYVLYFNRRG